MNDKNLVQVVPTAIYIETPRPKCRPEKIDSVLKKRMRDFLRARQRRIQRGTRP